MGMTSPLQGLPVKCWCNSGVVEGAILLLRSPHSQKEVMSGELGAGLSLMLTSYPWPGQHVPNITRSAHELALCCLSPLFPYRCPAL